MRTLTYTTRPERGRSDLRNSLDAIRAAFAGIRDGLDMARRYRALSALSNAELQKRGLRREEHHARRGSWREIRKRAALKTQSYDEQSGMETGYPASLFVILASHFDEKHGIAAA